MKKLLTSIIVLSVSSLSAQFTVSIESPANFKDDTVYLYTLNGSKDILATKVSKKNGSWVYSYPNSYEGMMKAYFPESNQSFKFVSENKNVNVRLLLEQNIIKPRFTDGANQQLVAFEDIQSKRENILPALYQIDSYYDKNSDFSKALNKEILRLSQDITIDASKSPFLAYFNDTYNQYLTSSATKPAPTQDELIHFFSSTNQYLETSGLMRPLLVNYLNSVNQKSAEESVDKLLSKVNVETSRGQIILSELIDIFDIYSLSDLKEKYISKAENLKCSINDRLASTIKLNKMLDIGAVFPDYTFNMVNNTTSKSINSVKADKKVIVFWSSSCSHCEQEIPQFLTVYNKMKARNMEIIGLSLDLDRKVYQDRVAILPWINDTELKGWNSSFNDRYNIHATPTYFILDKDNKIIAKPNHVGDVLEFLKLK